MKGQGAERKIEIEKWIDIRGNIMESEGREVNGDYIAEF